MIKQTWRSLLASDELGQRIVASHELDEVVSLMIEAKVDPQKFLGNLLSLITRGMPTIADMVGGESQSLPTTPSVARYLSIVNRPMLVPLWFLAGFPDVLAWVNEQQEALLHASVDGDEGAATIAKLYGYDVGSAEGPSEREVENPDGSLRARFYRNLIHNYIEQRGRGLETAVQEGTQDDIYLEMGGSQVTEEDSIFAVIANVTTKYYIELRRRYGSWFPDESALLAMTGILDANVYIYGTRQIKPAQIIELARATHGQSDRFLEFMVQFVFLLLSVDSPELPRDAILGACREQMDAIRHSIDDTIEGYRGEPMIARGVRAVMQSADFADLRDAVGVRAPSLLRRLKQKILGRG